MGKPILYVFAGGNGAGKSTFSYDLIPEGTIVINPDLIAKNSINSYVANEVIGKMKTEAIQNRTSILIETNFLFEDEIDTFLKFKQAGFEIHLYYFVLSSLKESELRVFSRQTKGGHFVDNYTRELNFTVGLDNAVNNSNHFDEVRLIANSIYLQKEILHAIGRDLVYEDYKQQKWTNSVAERFITELKENLN